MGSPWKPEGQVFDEYVERHLDEKEKEDRKQELIQEEENDLRDEIAENLMG